MIIAGNWKMAYLPRVQAQGLAYRVAEAKRDMGDNGREAILFPSFTLLDQVGKAIKGSRVMLGGQDCYHKVGGPFTGDVSAIMLKDAGCDWVLLGHSERRHKQGENQGETSEMVAAKAKCALEAGLKIMICVGETLEERESGKAEEVVKKQLEESLPSSFSSSTAKDFAIAYEPIWAIGTGKIPTMKEISYMHYMLHRSISVKLGDMGIRRTVPILYGGSVKPDNAGEILSLAEVDGALVGGASLKADEFIAIMNSALVPE